MKYKLTFALVAALTSTAFAEFKAPLPEFRNEKQLAEWRTEKASESASQCYAANQTAFYTGKPYLASTGGYAFKYRSYNSELARWTSEDPSGFPDGANGNIYISNMAPNSFDSDGLSRREIDEQSITPTGGIWQNVGYEYINNFYRIPYEVKYTYTTHFITEIGQSSGFGRALTGSSNVGFSQTTQASISATGWSVTLGLSVAETSSSATQIDYPRAATPRVAWEAKVLAFNADLHYHIRGELKDSNGAWTPDTTNNGGNWSNPTFLKSGYTSFFGKIVYKIYE